MNERKREVMESLKKKGIDLVKLEKELISLLRKGKSALDLESHIKKLIEVGAGERR